MKMVTINDIYNFLDVCAPFETVTSLDNVSFLAGGRETPVSAILLALDITPNVVGEAARLRAELIVSHHPVTFQLFRRMGPQGVPHLPAQHGIGAICAHTNPDLVPDGTNTCPAEASGLEDIRRAKPYGTNGL